MPLDFSDILGTEVGSMEKPKVAPAGHWRATVLNMRAVKPKDEDGDLSVAISVKLTEPQEDVDPDEVEAFGSDLEEARLGSRRWLSSKKQVFYFQKLLSDIGLSGTMEEAMAEAQGYEVIVEVVHAPNDDDPEIPYASINSILPV